MALHAATGWSGDALWWGTILACDAALDHPTPGVAFMLAIMELHRLWPDSAPPLDAVARTHAALRQALSSAEAEEMRSQSLTLLGQFIFRAESSSDRFDQAVLALFRRVREAQDVRHKTPSAFCEALLDTAMGQDLLTRFFLPSYRAGNAMYDLGEADLSEGARFIEAAVHRLHVHLEAWPAACPYLDLTICPETRSEACRSAPWTRPPEDGTTCLYGYAAHAMKHPARPRPEKTP